MGKKIVIVGGVAGGASAAARLRRLDETAEIVLLERGEYISFANCGLPYHVGGVIPRRESLLLQTPEAMRKKYRVDVRVRSEAVAIDRSKKTVLVRSAETGETYEEGYDKLILATGSSPIVPQVPGADDARVLRLWTVPDADRVRAMVSERGAKSAVVVGGGFIGLETAENLVHAGLSVTLVEKLDQVMPPLDPEMARLLQNHLAENGVSLTLGDGLQSFENDDGQLVVVLESGKKLPADFAVLAIGVRPNGQLAKDAGLAVNARGGVVVDERMRTSDPDIYAVGDVTEIADPVSGGRAMIPLAGPANKQGRVAANDIMDIPDAYEGTLGTSVVKVFDLAAASAGASEKLLKSRGLAHKKDYEKICITQNSHASYYPGATPMTLKLLFSADGKKIFGAQIVGVDGVDKRIDTIATAMRLGANVRQLERLELAYAPPFSSAKDPVNMAGFVAGNLLDGRIAFSDWDIKNHPGAALLDVREEAERLAYSVPGAVNIPLGELRARLSELDKSKETIVFCAIGVRAYNAARILMQNGFARVLVYPAGTRFYQSMNAEEEPMPQKIISAVSDSGHSEEKVATAAMRLDCTGMQCPGPIMRVFETVGNMRDGEIMEVTASDPGFLRDIGAWSRRTGNTLLGTEKRGTDYFARVQKGLVPGAPAPRVPADVDNGKTIIVFSGDLDRVLASFIIANGAAAMGRKVTMFFTFWGLNVLRKGQRQRVRKSAVEHMFGAMMPRGTGKLKLSKMNMMGMGTAMMKAIMRDKHVDSLEELVKKAMAAGVKIVACTMSMDVMGIKEQELIEGVELGGVGAYLGDAEESDVNLFI